MPQFQDIFYPTTSSSLSILENGLTVLADVDLPDGGDESSIAASSVVSLFSTSNIEREYYILNQGTTRVRIFIGGVIATWQANVKTPFILPPGKMMISTPATCRLPAFAWSDSGVGKLIVGIIN